MIIAWKVLLAPLPNVPVGYGNLIREATREITQCLFFVFILIIVIMFIIYWRYIRPKWSKKYIKKYYNLKGSNTLILQTKAELRKKAKR